MSMVYIRNAYRVPAKRGGRIEYTGEKAPRFGTIIGTYGARLKVRLDGDTKPGCFHPTWKICYLPREGRNHG